MQATSTHRLPRHLKNPDNIEFFNSHTLAGDFDLDKNEQQWRDRSEFIEAHGYLLRPRFRKGWKPSWLGTDLHPFDCEDFRRLISVRLIDATRISDGRRVILKRVTRGTSEIGLAQSLHTEGRSEDPDNHCVPILEYFDDMEDRTLGFLVMPLLRSFDEPPFAFISEVIDFVKQTLIGLRFLHCRRIAHRDLSGLNIMMDGDGMYPTGFHPSHHFLNPACTDFAKYRSRRDVPSVKYYIIDFGISSAFDEQGKLIEHFEVFRNSPEIPINDGEPPEDSDSDYLDPEVLAALKARLRQLDPSVDLEGIENFEYQEEELKEELPPFMVTGRDGLEREVPELSNDQPYNAFSVDIFTLGNLYRKAFLEKYSNLEFLSPLIKSMTQVNPAARPAVDEAIQHLEGIISNISRFQLCLPLRSVEEPLGRYSMAFATTKALVRECWVLLRESIRNLLLFSWLRRY